MSIIIIFAIVLMLFYLVASQKNNATSISENITSPDILLSDQTDKKEITNKNKAFELENQNNSSDNSEGLINIIDECEGNTVTFYINLNEKELINSVKKGSIINKPFYQKKIDDIGGLDGTKIYSANKEYCVISNDGYYFNNSWRNGEIALVRENILIFKTKLQRPHDCQVSNTGIVICSDWLNTDNLSGKFLIFRSSGELFFSMKTSANIGNTGISEDGNIALFETYHSETIDSNKIFIIDVIAQRIISKFERPYSFNNVHVNSISQRISLINQKGFCYEINFEGNHTNSEEFEKRIMQNGSSYDKLQLYNLKSDELKFRDKNYISVLQSSLKDSDTVYSFGSDKIYRMIGEYYYANNDIIKAIESWEKAIEINPKVGIKKKLDKIKKNTNNQF